MFYSVLFVCSLAQVVLSDDTVLVVGHGNHLSKVNISSGISEEFDDIQGTVVGVAVDFTRVFYTTVSSTTSTVQCIDKKGITTTIYSLKGGSGSVESLSVSDSGLLRWFVKGTSIIQSTTMESSGSCTPGAIKTITISTTTPNSITQDDCSKHLFWSTTGDTPTIYLLTSNNTTFPIITEDLHHPLGLLYNYYDKRLYWIDNERGTRFKIESSLYDGTNRVTILREENHSPYSLAVDSSTLYWSDWSSLQIWGVPLPSAKRHLPVKDHRSIWKVSSGRPNGLSVLSPHVFLDELCHKTTVVYENPAQEQVVTKTENKISVRGATGAKCSLKCLHGYCVSSWGLSTCICDSGFEGELCNITQQLASPACENFCFHGVCRLSNNNPVCKCYEGFVGERCEDNLCKAWCLNNGSCSMVDYQPTCHCLPAYWGVRCEELKETSSFCLAGVNKMFNPWLIATVVMASLLATVCIMLALLMYRIRGRVCRPSKMKTRFVGVKKYSTPSESNTVKDVEECCNFNVCETPCEAIVLKSGTRSEDKLKLLSCDVDY